MCERRLSRKACEAGILKRLIEIQQLYKRYNPNGDYLAMVIQPDYIGCNNAHWEENDKERPLDFYYINGRKGSVK